MADDDDATSYTANGPTDIGFRTHGTRITNGVVAFGTAIGVHGIGAQIAGTTAESIGVLGQSNSGYCVKGTTSQTAFPGVYGQSDFGTGVQGVGTTGVLGEGIGDGDLFGVHGTCGKNEGFNGIAVFGLTEKGVGVQGGSTFSTGVRGHSERGFGVHGSNDGSYGGVFRSNFAQIRLEPADSFGPPRKGEHRNGEFYVDKGGTLFYCIGADPPPRGAGCSSPGLHCSVGLSLGC